MTTETKASAVKDAKARLLACIESNDVAGSLDAYTIWINVTARRPASSMRQAVQSLLYDLEYEKKSLSDIRQITTESLNAERRLSR